MPDPDLLEAGFGDGPRTGSSRRTSATFRLHGAIDRIDVKDGRP